MYVMHPFPALRFLLLLCYRIYHLVFLYGLKSRVHCFEIHLASLFDNFLIENIIFIFGLHFKQNHTHLGFPIASYSPGLNFKHLMQYRFPQYSHSSILSFSLLKIFSQSLHFQASLTSLPDSEVLLPLRVPLFFSFVTGALEIATFSPVSYHMCAVVLRVRTVVSKAL